METLAVDIVSHIKDRHEGTTYSVPNHLTVHKLIGVSDILLSSRNSYFRNVSSLYLIYVIMKLFQRNSLGQNIKA